MTSMKIVQFLSPPIPTCTSTSKIPPHPWPWTSNLKRTLPPPSLSLQMITNQLKENIIQEWLLHIIRSFLQVGFRFQYQLNFFWLSFDFFSFSWSLTIYFFVALYSCVCVCVYVCVCVCLYVCVSFIYNYLHFWHSFCNQLVLIAQFESVNKL